MTLFQARVNCPAMPDISTAYADRLKRKVARLLGISPGMVIAYWKVEKRQRVWYVGAVRPSGTARTLDWSKPYGRSETIPKAVADLQARLGGVPKA